MYHWQPDNPAAAALLLDRDGVVNENRPDYVRSIEQVRLYPSALAALAAIAHLPIKIGIVTNQSGVGRGLIPRQTAEAINDHVVSAIAAAGGRVDGVFMCPHAPAAGCACRKPAPGLLYQAAAELQIDLAQSIFVGDALTDVAAGQAAGVAATVLVLSGRGQAQYAQRATRGIYPDAVQADLAAVIRRIVL